MGQKRLRARYISHIFFPYQHVLDMGNVWFLTLLSFLYPVIHEIWKRSRKLQFKALFFTRPKEKAFNMSNGELCFSLVRTRRKEETSNAVPSHQNGYGSYCKLSTKRPYTLCLHISFSCIIYRQRLAWIREQTLVAFAGVKKGSPNLELSFFRGNGPNSHGSSELLVFALVSDFGCELTRVALSSNNSWEVKRKFWANHRINDTRHLDANLEMYMWGKNWHIKQEKQRGARKEAPH